MSDRLNIDKVKLRIELCKILSSRFNGTVDPEAYGDYLLELIIQYGNGFSSKEESLDSIKSLFDGFVTVFLLSFNFEF